VFDLLLHVPLRYEDRSRESPVDRPGQPGDRVLVRGRLRRVSRARVPGRRLDIVRADLVSDEGGTLPVAWFNQGWMEERATQRGEVRLWGVLRQRRGGRLELVNPEMTVIEGEEVVPVYRRLGPLAGRRLRGVIHAAAGCLGRLADPLEDDERSECAVMGLVPALHAVHEPAVGQLVPGGDVDRARERLAFDELLGLTVRAAIRRRDFDAVRAPRLDVGGDRWSPVVASLPFELTAAQRRVVGEIRNDLACGRPMARLVQGDVGCGKTVVATLAMVIAARCGYQAAFMAPTETLAWQHARSVDRIVGPLGVTTATLVGSISTAEARRVRREVASGDVSIVIGTHALFQASVQFARLGLVVVDEQHRFGVLQRQALVDKGNSPHLLVMTATPIPRSLALAVHGDLDLSLIDEVPPGRARVRTVIRTADSRHRLVSFLRREVADGGRVFWVFPVIDGSDEAELPALIEHEAALRTELAPARVGVVHGRLSSADREATAESFRRGELDVLLATTVVEVGLDVPQASVMVIEGADRFGLSQLHQLRGRVGRGQRQSWCVALIGGEASESAQRRLELFCELDDGFRIAEADLDLRGPGEIDGVRQWGRSGFRFADLARDGDLLDRARASAQRMQRSGRLGEVAVHLHALYGHVADMPPA
jgi:ATP-dependent DNA helicase RecG